MCVSVRTRPILAELFAFLLSPFLEQAVYEFLHFLFQGRRKILNSLVDAFHNLPFPMKFILPPLKAPCDRVKIRSSAIFLPANNAQATQIKIAKRLPTREIFLLRKTVVEPRKDRAGDPAVKQRVESPHDHAAKSARYLVTRIDRAHDVKEGSSVRWPEEIQEPDKENGESPENSRRKR